MKWKHNEPFFWLMFGGGGVMSSMILPVFVLITGILVPLGLLPEGTLSYQNAMTVLGNGWVQLFVWAVISLTAWHAMHRIVHGMHDLGFLLTNGIRFVGYGIEMLVTVLLGYYFLAI